jgi:hypothetical protein
VARCLIVAADLRVPEWGRLLTRPEVAVEPALAGPAAITSLAEVARSRRWRVAVSEDGLTVRIKDVAVPVNLRHLVREPADLWRSSMVRAEAADDGVGGCRVDVVVEDRGSVWLRPRVATLLSGWVATMESRGIRVRTGTWRDEDLDRRREEAGEQPLGPQAWSEEGVRLVAVAERERAERPTPGPFELSDGVGAWAEDLAQTCGTSTEPLTAGTARAWVDGLVSAGASRMRQPQPPYVVDSLVGAAVRGGVLRLPEPGVLRMAFAARDPESGSEAWGWGFKPGSTAALGWHATRTCRIEELTSDAVGGEAVVEVLTAVVASLEDLEPGPVDELRCW